MKTVFVTAGTTSFDELIIMITTPEAVKVSSFKVLSEISDHHATLLLRSIPIRDRLNPRIQNWKRVG